MVASFYRDAAATPGATFTYDNATHYSYDINGNVDHLWQDIGALKPIQGAKALKQITYDYDLVSGKVNQVSYQPGKADQFL